jgi:hypothetical protein
MAHPLLPISMFHIERDRGRIEVRFDPDPALVENFVQILAHVLIQEHTPDAYPLLAVVRELVLRCMAPAATRAEVHACIERVRGGIWRVTVAPVATAAGGDAGSPGVSRGHELAREVGRSSDGLTVSAVVDCSGRAGRRLARQGGRQ